MSVTTGDVRSDAGHQSVATLVRVVPVKIVEVSQGDCRLESAARLEPGLSGQLVVELQGVARIDDVRITRCQQRVGGGPAYQIGAELLKTRRLGRRSVRLAVRKIIGEHAKGNSHARGKTPVLATTNPWAGEAGSRSAGRSPPAQSDRGS